VEVETGLLGVLGVAGLGAGAGVVCESAHATVAENNIEDKKRFFIECSNSSLILYGVYQALLLRLRFSSRSGSPASNSGSLMRLYATGR
jgi:hypothetical protein